MNHCTIEAGIVQFLEQSKELIAQGKLEFVPRQKNISSLANHGLNIGAAEDEMLSLEVNDYISGPESERDPGKHGNGDIWIFKKEIDGIWFYIKFKISKDGGRIKLKCLSFHEDEI